jgi:hypothetical protein
LPLWAKETVLRELQKTYDLLEKREVELRELKAYIAGLETGVRTQRKIVINNGEVKK